MNKIIRKSIIILLMLIIILFVNMNTSYARIESPHEVMIDDDSRGHAGGRWSVVEVLRMLVQAYYNALMEIWNQVIQQIRLLL